MTTAPRADAEGLDATEWMKLGAKAAMAGATTVEQAVAWLVETSGAAPAAQEDSESSPMTPAARAAHLANDILTRPLTDPQAIELAKVFALIAIHERMPELKPAPSRKPTTKKA